jgi:hypothetical protein
MRILTILLLFSLNAGASEIQEIVVSEGHYYLNGDVAHDLSELETRFTPTDPVVVRACECAATSRLTDLMDWLTEEGKEKIPVVTVTSRELEVCGDCQ